MKQFSKILGITANCVAILLLAWPSAWLLGRELETVQARLGLGAEGRIRILGEKADAAGDARERWRLCRKMLDIDRENREALSRKGKIAYEYAQQAREMKLKGQTREAISTLVLAIRVDPQLGYLWNWMEEWVKDWAKENRKPPARPQAATGKKK